MPSLVTHQLCAYEALNQAKQDELTSIIFNYPEAFSIGSSGPDFLFFYHFWPFGNDPKTKQFYDLGNLIHQTHINQVFAQALTQAKQNDVHREETISYLAGWLCHYALDRNAHPFIFYWSGFGDESSNYHHRRMEAMIDALMIRRKLGRDIKTYRPADVVRRSSTIHQAMGRLMTPIAKNMFQVSLSDKDILRCLRDMKLLYQILYDPYGWKFPILKRFEKIPYAFTGTLIKRIFTDQDESYDVLNKQARTWIHPCDDSLESQDTFVDCYDRGVRDAIVLLDLFAGYLFEDVGLNTILEHINDRTYDTGFQNSLKMKHASDKYSI